MAKSQPFDLVIFDCDGVLVDSETISASSLAECLTQAGLPIDTDYVMDHYLGRSFAVIEADYRVRTGQPLPDGFADGWYRVLFAAFERELKPIEGVAVAIGRLSLPKCVASSSAPNRLALSLKVTALGELFGANVFNATMVRRGKPAPDLFLYCATQMGASPSRTLVIEDSVTGVQAGVAAGMTVWGFVGGKHYQGRNGAETLRAAGADRVFASMAEFGLD